MIEKYPKFPLLKPCIELAKKWRTETQYKWLEGTILVVDPENIIEIDGEGNVLLHDRFRAIGSGGLYAECAAEALFEYSEFDSLYIA